MGKARRLPARRTEPTHPIVVRIPAELCPVVEELAIGNRCSYQQQAEILLKKGIEALHPQPQPEDTRS